MINYGIRIRAWILTFMLLTGLYAGNVEAQETSNVTIPESRFYPALHGYNTIFTDSFAVLPSFEATPFITLAQYKQFIESRAANGVCKDSLMPDRSIASAETYEKYTHHKKYESYPVVGVSWQNALEYCIWRTQMENPDSGIVFIYRLPYKSEWEQMALYADSALKKFEINRHYAEWIMASFDESALSFPGNLNNAYTFEYLYLAGKSDPQVLKRMCIYGKSFLSNHQKNLYGYSDQGYRDVGFRMVKEYVNVPGRKPSPVVLNDKIMQLYGVKH
ncbi:MAG TPA: SUMF1/EgtB/PvdO family nonheme iron enzyme [Bacteroidales bacterium]|nr:SUMF1/EgtB/PvdO family nonheme iron enzyme [Bacteroidales bacterium]